MSASRRTARHGRHGRLWRSPVVRPPLPALDSRIDRFDAIAGETCEFLREVWPELREVSFEIGSMPERLPSGAERLPRWLADRARNRIVLYRVPIERAEHLHRDDDYHRRLAIEMNTYLAAADYLGREPWELRPDRFR